MTKSSAKPSLSQAPLSATATKKARAQNSAPKTTTPKTTTKRLTTAALAQSVATLERRLKAADTRNRKAVKSLEAILAELQTKNSAKDKRQNKALKQKLTQLEIGLETHFSQLAKQARAEVRAALKPVTQPGANQSTLQSALANAQNTITAQDQQQREALIRLNRHVADMANIIDGRFEKTRAETHAVEARINGRIDQVEIDTATALENIGQKVSEFAGALKDRAQESNAQVAERLADLAQETQAEIDATQSHVINRLDNLENRTETWEASLSNVLADKNDAPADDPRIDDMGRTIENLQGELARMHARLAILHPVVQPVDLSAVEPLTAQEPDTFGSDALIEPLELNEPSYMSAHPSVPHSHETLPEAPLAAPSPAPLSSELPPNIPEAVAPYPTVASEGLQGAFTADDGAFVPQEFNPASYKPAQMSAAPLADNTAPKILTNIATGQTHHTTPMAEPSPLADPFSPTEPFPLEKSGQTAPLPMQTYADPAYGEDNAMRAERVAETSPKRKIKRPALRLPKLNIPISNSTLKMAGISTAVALIGLFTVKSILGSEPAPQTAQTQTTQTSSNDFTGAATPVSAPTQNDFESTPLTTKGDAKLDTLRGAVAAGNPIAQFQQGLLNLQTHGTEHDKTAEGVNLIRLAANQNLTIAQYRLAKLYEAGIGVTPDLVTARGLYERAAMGGNLGAMYRMGSYNAMPPNDAEPDLLAAASWFEKAAEHGVVNSQFNIATLNEGKNGLPENLAASYFWYGVAAKQGDEAAALRMEEIKGALGADTLKDIQGRISAFTPKPIDEAANGIFKDVAWSDDLPRPATASNAKVQIQTAQTLLTELGFDIGGADGAAGPKTRAAIKEFEQISGLPQTGEVTPGLISRLKQAAGA